MSGGLVSTLKTHSTELRRPAKGRETRSITQLLALEGWPHIPAFLKEFYPAVSKSLRFISLPVLVVSISRREGRMELSGFWFKFENESGPSVTGRPT